MDGDEMFISNADLASLSEEMRSIRNSAEAFSTALTQGMRAALIDGRELSAVMRSVALSLSGRVLAQSLAPLERFAGTLFGGLLGSFQGVGTSLVQGFTTRAFARGGIVSAPTYFGMASGEAGVMGEAGAEAILPLKRGMDGRLGVVAQDRGGPTVVFNVTARDADSFQRSEAQITALIARAVGRGRRGL